MSVMRTVAAPGVAWAPVSENQLVPRRVVDVEEHVRAQRDRARRTLSDYTQRAAEILQELAELAENDRVRLAAVNSILDRAGVTAPTEVKVTATQEEHQVVTSEVQATLERLAANVKAQEDRQLTPSLEALVVHEGESESTHTE